MKEIKAFIHRNRLADIIHALRNAGLCGDLCNLSVADVTGTLQALDAREQDFSLDMGDMAVNELKLEVMCADEWVDRAVSIIRANGRTGQAIAGWIYVIDVVYAYPIDGN